MSHHSSSSKTPFRALEVLHELATEHGWVRDGEPELNCSDDYFVEYNKEGRVTESFYVSNTTIQIVPFNDKVNTIDLYNPDSLKNLEWYLSHQVMEF
jgi:hypothetical protein